MEVIQTLRYIVPLISIFTYYNFLVKFPSFCNAQTNNTTNTIKAGQALSYSDKLVVSADGRFRLGFFNVSDSSNGFLGIRYAYERVDDVVWVANRDTPIYGVNATLAMDADGLLKITRGGGEYDPIPINSNRTAPNSTATLENTGNLVVRDLSSNRVLWQSFDYPTDTLLPGMKLGANLATGKRWILTSWLSENNPSTGAFTLEYNHSGKASHEVFVVRRRGNLFSRSGPEIMGPWGKNQISYVSNKDEIYFNFSGGNIINLSLRLNPDGSVSHVTTNGSDTILNGCNGGLEFLYYCAEQGKPNCRSNREDAFVRRGSLYLDSSVNSSNSHWDNNSSNVVSDCFQRCASNCSCIGFNTLFSDETGCVFYSEGARFEVSRFTDDDYIFLLNSSYPNPSDEKSKSEHNGSGEKWWTCVIVCAIAFVLF